MNQTRSLIRSMIEKWNQTPMTNWSARVCQTCGVWWWSRWSRGSSRALSSTRTWAKGNIGVEP